MGLGKNLLLNFLGFWSKSKKPPGIIALNTIILILNTKLILHFRVGDKYWYFFVIAYGIFILIGLLENIAVLRTSLINKVLPRF